MKYLLLLATTAAAVSQPWTLLGPEAGDYGSHLARRGRDGHGKTSARITRMVRADRTTKDSRPPDSPPRDGDTRVEGTIKGTGRLMTARAKNHGTRHAQDSTPAGPGEPVRKDTHDAAWSKVHAHTDPQDGAAGGARRERTSQSPLLQPVRVSGTGQSGTVRVKPPPAGGFGWMKKEVNGVVVENKRVGPGEIAEATHTGRQHGEVKFSGFAGRGGEAFVSVNNLERATD